MCQFSKVYSTVAAALASAIAIAPGAQAQNSQQSECRGVVIDLIGPGSMSSNAPLVGPCIYTVDDHELRVYRNRISFNGDEFDVSAEESVRLEARDGGVILDVDGEEVTRLSPVPALEERVEAGDLQANLQLAQMYIDGDWVDEDRARVVELLIPPAEDGDTRAQAYLAIAFNDGNGVEADPEAAMRWAEMSQDADSNSRRILANGLYSGEGIEEDVTRALSLWASAAEEGDAIAAFNLGVVIRAGVKVAFNRDSAIAWFERALELGYEDAQAELDALRE